MGKGMIRYGNYKRGSGKLHPHNECGVCSEKTINKKAARREDRELAKEGMDEYAEMLSREDEGVEDETGK